MTNAPVYHINPEAFHANPYPDLEHMRTNCPIAFVPEMGATLLTRRADIFKQEKRTDVFSSSQPGGLMNILMGENMMRKDGAEHQDERKAIFPTISPRTVKDVWLNMFHASAEQILERLAPIGQGDLVRDYAMPLSGEALRVITGLTNMGWQEMDRVSQGMIDGISNYQGNQDIEARCHECTALIDRRIDAMMPLLMEKPDHSLLSVQMQAGLSNDQIRANIKLAISGGQNEPRDVIAGAIWALLTHPDQLEPVLAGEIPWMQVFEEYTRWCSPIGMSPRRIAKNDVINGITFEEGDRVFLMYSSANRDESVFGTPEQFDLSHDTGPSIAFGAGPHFCAGAWASRALIAEVALPMAFDRLPGLRLKYGSSPQPAGWAFRGLTNLPCEWDA
jgi:cytochrome P450